MTCLYDAVDTTHLILARSTTPFLVSSLLRRTIPTLAFGLVVLDISCVLFRVFNGGWFADVHLALLGTVNSSNSR